MPACSSENYPRFWSSSPPPSRSNSASPPLPSSPISTSPPSVLHLSSSAPVLASHISVPNGQKSVSASYVPTFNEPSNMTPSNGQIFVSRSKGPDSVSQFNGSVSVSSVDSPITVSTSNESVSATSTNGLASVLSSNGPVSVSISTSPLSISPSNDQMTVSASKQGSVSPFNGSGAVSQDSKSPISVFTSPFPGLKRSTSNVSNSSNHSQNPTVIFRRRSQQSQHNCQHQSEMHQRRRSTLLSRIFSWYLGIISGIFRTVLNAVSYVVWAPGLWASAWVCLFWIILQLPLTMLKWFITVLHTPASERARNKRCVLISGGSTVQAVRLAQNFYKAGARVVVFDLEGLFALARFSTACSKYYTVPKPGPGSAAEYVKALKDIVQKERASYYIPVSATSAAYYDALAKQYLEIMGCECFVPGAAEVTALDDPLELLRRCRSLGLPTPTNFVLKSEDDVTGLYEAGYLRTGRHVMLAAGPAGMRDRTKITLPPTIREFRHQEHDISERKPWVVIRDPGGSHFITCTTIKDSQVVANITCRVDEVRGLIPEERLDVNQWLNRFFARTFGSRINGHLSFRLAISKDSGELVSIGCRVGIGLPYVCHTSVHPRLVWRPCRHFSRHNSGPLVIGGRPLNQEDVATALKRTSSEPSFRLLDTVLDKRKALFVYWDPLPYCAYYYLQLPFRRVAGAIRAQPRTHNPPLAVVR